MCAGAMLLDLILRKKITVENKRIIVIDPSPTEDDRLNTTLLKMISTTRKPQEVWKGLEMVRKYNNAKVIPEFLEEQRVNQNVIIETKKSLKFFTRKTYKLTKVNIYADLLKQIHKGITDKKKGDPRIIALISLLYTCKGYRQLIPVTLLGSESIRNRIEGIKGTFRKFKQSDFLYSSILKRMKELSQNTEYYELIQIIPKYSLKLSDTG